MWDYLVNGLIFWIHSITLTLFVFFVFGIAVEAIRSIVVDKKKLNAYERKEAEEKKRIMDEEEKKEVELIKRRLNEMREKDINKNAGNP